MKNFQIFGNRLHFVERNAGEALGTLLFIHGNSHSLNTFSEQMSSDVLSKYHLLFVDLPGHGESSFLPQYSLKDIAEMLNVFVRELELENVIIVGHSLGGHVAINMLKTSSKPLGLFLFGTPPLQLPFDPNVFTPNPRIQALVQEHSTDDEINQLMEEMNYHDQQKLNAISDYKKTDLKFRTSILGDIITNTNEDEINLLKTFPGEVMFLLASNDGLINNSYIAKECFHLKEEGIHHKEITSGHSPHIEKADEFNSRLSEFCEYVFVKNNPYEKSKKYNGNAIRNIYGTEEGIKEGIKDEQRN